MRRRGADLVLFIGALALLTIVSVALVIAPLFGIALAVLVGLGSIAVFARVSPAYVGAGFIALSAFTVSWDEVQVASVPVRYLFLLGGLTLLAVVQATKQLPRIPCWVHCFALAAITAAALQTLLPVSQAYLDTRYLTSEGGVALGSRPPPLANLTYLMVNLYLVPVGVVLACMAVPKALRLIIYAYVAGAAVSSIAGYLGFIGVPWLVDLLASPIPAGTRALGYTAHPLHLATSAVMASALAVWMALQPRFAVRWVGRVSVVALVLGLYSSGSRGGNVAGLLALALCVLLLPSIRRRWHNVAAAVVSLSALVFAFIPAAGTEILRTTRVIGGGETARASDYGRDQLFEQAISDFAQSPIYGIGPRYLGEAHILYVGLLASGGILMFLGYLFFTVGSLRDAFRAMAVNRALGGAIAATLIASLAYWVVADLFVGPVVQTVYGILIVLVVPQLRDDLVAVFEPRRASSGPDRPSTQTPARR